MDSIVIWNYYTFEGTVELSKYIGGCFVLRSISLGWALYFEDIVQANEYARKLP